jgi:hypothetical protein
MTQLHRQMNHVTTQLSEYSMRKITASCEGKNSLHDLPFIFTTSIQVLKAPYQTRLLLHDQQVGLHLSKCD